MDTVTTGRPLAADGTPTDGPALELDPDGPAADLLAESPHALASGPGSGMWSVRLETPPDEAPAMVVWLAPDATVLPTHRHAVGDEAFRALRGTLTVVEEGAEHRLDPGEERVVAAGRDHQFRNDTDGVVAVRVAVPWEPTVETQYTVFGLDHEGAFGDDGGYGEPGPLYALVMSEYLREGTTITGGPPRVVQRALWATVGRVAKARGLAAVEERFLDDAYWERTVEQPGL
jgi:quercetin dioxygenase-like cupin family protein